jgi:hypothetical protein
MRPSLTQTLLALCDGSSKRKGLSDMLYEDGILGMAKTIHLSRQKINSFVKKKSPRYLHAY